MHYIHLGRVGLVINFRWGEMADFLLGFTTLDFAHDDGRMFGHWGWLPARDEPAEKEGERKVPGSRSPSPG